LSFIYILPLKRPLRSALQWIAKYGRLQTIARSISRCDSRGMTGWRDRLQIADSAGHPATGYLHEIASARLARQSIALAADRQIGRLPDVGGDRIARIIPGFDAWDMWPIAYPDGSTFTATGRQFWLFLASPILADPEDRHDIARIRLTSLGGDGWRDHGWAFPDQWSPGAREWSGCAILETDGRSLTMYFTAAGRRGMPSTFEQRLFETRGELAFDGDVPVLGNWSQPVESVAADGKWYKIADQTVAPAHGISGFRDPGYFRDPEDGAEFLLFTGSAGWTQEPLDGVIGVARRSGDGWCLRPPLIEAIGVSSELERPHIVVRDGHYYCFWSTHGRKYAPDLRAPTGLYAMVAERFAGPWRPVNGSGLVVANPISSPFQAYCWWVTGEGDVMSFLDYPGCRGAMPPQDASQRRILFGGTAAPIFRLAFDGETVASEAYEGAS
jgi:levansucrase